MGIALPNWENLGQDVAVSPRHFSKAHQHISSVSEETSTDPITAMQGHQQMKSNCYYPHKVGMTFLGCTLKVMREKDS